MLSNHFYILKKVQIIYLLAGIAFGMYVLLRASLISITYDEVWTIDGFVPQSVIHILNFTPCDANNHILNTLLIKFFYIFNDNSLFFARIPNVLAFILYAYYAFKICYKHLPIFLGLICYLLLLMNPFLLDFFSIARGYGLALAFQIGAIYYLLQYFKREKSFYMIYCFLFTFLAVLSNFSVLNFFLALLVVVNLLNFFQLKKNIKIGIIYSFISLLIAGITLYEPIRKLRLNESLYYGGNTGFYEDTLVSLTKYSLYTPNVDATVYIVLNSFLILFLAILIVSFFSKPLIYSIQNVLLAVLVICVLSIVSQFYLLGNLYVIDRAALFFYPLLIFSFCFTLNNVRWKTVRISVGFVVLIFFSVNSMQKMNFYKTAIWYFDAHSIEILDEINRIGEEVNTRQKVDFSWPFQSSFAYYAKGNNYPYVEIVKNNEAREEFNPKADYYVFLNKSLEKVGYEYSHQEVLNHHNKDTIKVYPNEGVVVFSLH